MPLRTVCVIPARYGSTRLPGKPLIPLLGKPMIQWVYEAADRAIGVDEVLVATDDDRIRQAVEAFGGLAVMTPSDCPSGSDRICNALEGREADIVINIQGDEPGMNPGVISAALDALLGDPDAHVATCCVALTDREEFQAPHVVKVVRGQKNRALYFSRSPIPSPARRSFEDEPAPLVYGYKHLGIYVYRREALEDFVRMPPGVLEEQEKLEQLRFLEAGYCILCPETRFDSVGVDVESDIAAAEAQLRKLHHP